MCASYVPCMLVLALYTVRSPAWAKPRVVASILLLSFGCPTGEGQTPAGGAHGPASLSCAERKGRLGSSPPDLVDTSF
ncbi:hypothetical protein QBC46DRAFT_368936 [Diplogelasinospora grovesii]|uniref:Secreted protein n=1 Tax=Diplogelasinospora grovesii TaxID=303347 RepID=A0AAN6SA65_9PEZI|nr:hypothetical protein QBC46DRAFT_368936 [Diplogelasinospora grovesii]